MRSSFLAGLTLALLPAPASPQVSDNPRPLLPREAEIRLARSAAPPEVSRAATVYVLERGGFVLGSKGTSGVTCLVDRSRPGSLEPHCFDPEGSATIVPIRLQEMAWREAGVAEPEIAHRVAEGIRSGRFTLPSRPVLSYMMSAGQKLIDDDGKPVGAWRPHLMLYVPNITTEQLGLGGAPSTRAAMVFEPGTPLASIVIVVRDFVRPEEFGRAP